MSKIIAVYIEITGTCNERCPYCYNSRLVNTGKRLPFPALSDLFNQLGSHNILSAALSGGEPFLHPEIADILANAKEKNIGIMIISNGVCFEDKNIPILLEYQPELQLTFDGWDSESHNLTRGVNNFVKLTAGLRSAHKHGYNGKVHIRLNLGKHNIGHIADTLKMLELEFSGENITSISASLLRKSNRENDCPELFLAPEEYLEYPEIFEDFEKWTLSGGVKVTYDFNNPDFGCPYNSEIENVQCGLRIALDGNVFPCQSFTDDIFSFGNIENQSLDEILGGEKFRSFVDAVHTRKSKIEKCKSCGYTRLCVGGCPATAYVENGTINSVSDRCSWRKSALNKNLLRIIQDAVQSSATFRN
jgi:uncharacterized protein